MRRGALSLDIRATLENWAALPQHIAVSLRLTGRELFLSTEAMPQILDERRLSLLNYLGLVNGKPEAYRYVLGQSRPGCAI